MRFSSVRGKLALASALALALGALGSCRGSTEKPEAGAVLLSVTLGAGAETPDEIRTFVYDDTGVLWSDVRIPAQGPLVPESATLLGTILIQPGTTVGDLRIDLHGLLRGTPVDEGTLRIPPASVAGGTFDVTLAAALPGDSDGDGVPDPIDDCPAVPDPKQAGCSTDGGVADGAIGHRDAAADARPDGPAIRPDAGRPDAGRRDAGRPDAGRMDAGRDVPPKAQGTSCGAAPECASGFCKDGVCCNNACTDACNSCSTGKCTEVKNATDDPECIAPMTCNNKGKCIAAAAGGN